jgi:hypothetical protein
MLEITQTSEKSLKLLDTETGQIIFIPFLAILEVSRELCYWFESMTFNPGEPGAAPKTP